MARQIALFGGSFDPVHNGHLIVARALAESRGFDRIILVPAANAPHKPAAQASPADRLAMLRLATAGEDLFEISDCEIRRCGPSYTVETLEHFRRQYGSDVKLHWLIGTDMLAELSSWHRVTEVIDMAEIIIAARPPWHLQTETLLDDLQGAFSPEQLQRIRRGVFLSPLIDVSSSQVRIRVKSGRSIRYLVPNEVMGYILKGALYREDLLPT